MQPTLSRKIRCGAKVHYIRFSIMWLHAELVIEPLTDVVWVQVLTRPLKSYELCLSTLLFWVSVVFYNAAVQPDYILKASLSSIGNQ